MKKFIYLFALMMIGILMINFVSQAQGEDEYGNKNRPKYKITVTHKGETLGDIIVETFPEVAEKHARNFDSLVSVGFYNGTAFHRVVDNFVIQGGDPNSKDKPKNTWGMGAPGQTKIPLEVSEHHHIRGILSMARTNDPNSATSQFFICLASTPHLDGQYSIFGRVLEGLDVVDKIVDVPRSGQSPNDKVEMKIEKMK